MTIAERLQADLRTAMLDHDELRRDTLRMVIAAAYNAEKAARRPLSDDELIGVLAREVKTRRESIEAYERADRPDLADRERREAAIIAEYLPAALGEDELRGMVTAAISQAGATSARDLGRVMAIVAPQAKGRADGRALSAMVAQELARLDLAGHDATGH